ncbi:MAG TPA: DUF4873 domain-containing protein [Amycolatopsis sp.]|uniref:DUF4873 domain-containing protein n=1 Tax=Amycolatopsis sp. TaxID=37632 RepID=UPI002B48A53E|nr:DUF4873 domain-containing protein [Amycolatopsis sp.]HKS44245.1 DUF4873 domain-containing protein [Amycolatopsis sp.]
MPDEDGYRGAATLVIDGTEFAVDVDLRGHLQPIDGYYHWYGRIAVHDGLAGLLNGRGRAGELRTPEGVAQCEVADPDPWGRYRVRGTSTPPFKVFADLPSPAAPYAI